MKDRTMHNSSALMRQEFLNKWLKGLQTFAEFKDQMTILERKQAIKLSADVAIASTRKAATHWSRATMAGAATMAGGATVVEQITGPQETNKVLTVKCKNKNLQRAHSIRKKAKKKGRSRAVPPRMKSVSIAKKLAKNRTRVLKGLVPGGNEMDGVCLIKETLDYIASLKVQVDVMRHVAATAAVATAAITVGGLHNQERS